MLDRTKITATSRKEAIALGHTHYKSKCKKGHDGIRDIKYQSCIDCSNSYTTKEHQRNLVLIRKFGITLEEYDFLLNHQEFKCGICGCGQADKTYGLAVDHCHETNIIRGLLCRDCNIGLGMFKDDVVLLEKAIKWIKNI